MATQDQVLQEDPNGHWWVDRQGHTHREPPPNGSDGQGAGAGANAGAPPAPPPSDSGGGGSSVGAGPGSNGGGGTGGAGGDSPGDGTGGDQAGDGSGGLFGDGGVVPTITDSLGATVGNIGGDGLGNLITDLGQTVSAIGSSTPIDQLFNTPGNGLNLGDVPHLGDPADLGQIVGGLDVGNLGETVGGLDVGNLGGTVGAIGSGNIDGILNAVGADAGNLVDGLLDTVAGDGSVVGNLLNTLGSDVVNGAVGGTGLLDGTPLEGLQGDGGLLSGNIMRGDDSSSSSSAQVGVGNDPSDGLINLDAASDRSTSESNHVVNTDVGPQTSGNGINADVAGADRDSSGALIDGDVGQHEGPSLVDANVGTNADQFNFPSLDGAGLDSLVGEVGGIGGVGGIGDVGGIGGNPGDGGSLMPVSVGVDGQVLADVDLSGTASAGDTTVDQGTDVMLNTPLHGNALV
jgi:hypothetical protein